MVHDERDHHAEESQTKKGSGIKFGGGGGGERSSARGRQGTLGWRLVRGHPRPGTHKLEETKGTIRT